jgi:hypothetical protein
MLNEYSPNSQYNFICQTCDYKCNKKSDHDKHLLTRKHINANKVDINSPNKIVDYKCIKCGVSVKHLSSLSRHKKKCFDDENVVIPNKPENVIVHQDSSNNEVIQLLIKENTDFKTMLMDMMKNTTDLVKNNTDLQRQMLELCKNHTTINATNNNINDNSNKTFNLQVFLNEKCKNAMNLDDFANSIQLKLSDLIRVGEEGYVPGMSKVIIERLGDIEECDRPIHCSDEKREAVQVKMANKWEREAIDSVNLTNAVRIIEQKQFDMLTTFRDTYPECMNSESHHNDMLIKLFQNLSNSKQPEFIKVLKKVAKSVVIDKEKYLKAA